jgi:hypothetical protein
LTHVLLALLVVIVFARSLGLIFRRIDQRSARWSEDPLGPSFLGHFAPAAFVFVFPNTIAQRRRNVREQRRIMSAAYVIFSAAYLIPGLDFRLGWTRAWTGGVPL